MEGVNCRFIRIVLPRCGRGLRGSSRLVLQVQQAVQQLVQQYRALVVGLLQSAKAQNLLAPGTDLPSAALLFLGSIQGLVMQSLLSGDVQAIARQAPGVFAIFVRGIAAKETP